MKTITKTILTNALKRAGEYQPKMVNGHNVRVNGVTRGFSGIFEIDGAFLHVNTEPCCLASLADQIMIRKCRHASDWSGGWGAEYANIWRPATVINEPEVLRREFYAAAHNCTLEAAWQALRRLDAAMREADERTAAA